MRKRQAARPDVLATKRRHGDHLSLVLMLTLAMTVMHSREGAWSTPSGRRQ